MSKDRNFTEKVKNSLRIEDIISETISLHQEGTGLLAGAVSTGSKSGASLKIDTRQQIFHDFAGGAGGDVFSWIAFEKNLNIKDDFREILKIAAEKAGIPFEEQTEEQLKFAEETREVKDILTRAADIYHEQLTPELRKYITEKWGITDETINALKIGYAHPTRTLTLALDRKDLVKAGLINPAINREFFLGRITFPYWKGGQVVYFAARGDPKALGTPDNEYEGKYKKLLTHGVKHPEVHPSVNNRYLWGEDTVKGMDSIIITEGIADAVVLYQNSYGVLSPVTTNFAGIDDDKALQLTKNAKCVYICNDNEPNKSGEKGSIKTGALLTQHNINAKIMTLPSDTGDKIDVAEYFLTHTKDDFESVKATALPFWEFLYPVFMHRPDISDIQQPKNRVIAFFEEYMIQSDFSKVEDFIKAFVKDAENMHLNEIKAVITECKKRKASHDKEQAAKKASVIKEENVLFPFELTSAGVTKTELKYAGDHVIENKRLFIRSPVTITGISIDVDTGIVKYKINIDNPNTGIKSYWKNPEELLTREGIKKLIAENLLVTETDHADTAEYFLKDISRASNDGTKKEVSAATTGWKKDRSLFATGDSMYSTGNTTSLVFTDEDIKGAIQQKGSLSEWISGMQWALSNTSTRVNCYTIMSAVIAGLLRQPSPILQNKGSTSTGKTLKSLVGLSMVADPIEFMKSADTTRAGAERRAIITNGYCDVYDEIGLAKQKDQEGLVYMLSNGIGRQRANQTGVDATPRWFKSFILNGELSILKDSAMQGETGRLIECTKDLEHNTEKAKATEACFRNNYGLILPLYLKKLFENIDKVERYYFHLMKEMPEAQIDIGGRLRDSFALLIIAGELLESVFADIGIEEMNARDICIDLYNQNVTSERVKPYWYRSLNALYDVILTCKMNESLNDEGKRVPTDEFLYKGQIAGEFKGNEIYLEPAALKSMCDDLELRNTTLAKLWKEQGLTKCNGERPDFNIRRNGNYHRVICLYKNKVEELFGYNELSQSDDRNQKQVNEDFLRDRVRKHMHDYKASAELNGNIEDSYTAYVMKHPTDEERYGKGKILEIMRSY